MARETRGRVATFDRGRLVNPAVTRDVVPVQLAATATTLFALDAHGNVWEYFPAVYYKDQPEMNRYAFWGRKTSRGSDATGKPLEHEVNDSRYRGESGGRRR